MSAGTPPDAAAGGHLGHYLYGVAGPEVSMAGLPGVDGEHPVGSLAIAGLQALVGHVPLAEFGPGQLEAHLGDAAWLAEKAQAHARVVALAQRRGTVIPAKFGTVFLSEDSLRQKLTAGQAEFLALLRRLSGKEEWGLRLYTEPLRLREALLRAEPAYHDSGQAGSAVGAGTAYLLRKRLEEGLVRRLDEAVQGRAQEAFLGLRSLAVDARTLLPLHDASDPAPRLALHAAFLIRKRRRGAFLRAVAKLHLPGEGWAAALSGPWAPYHFLDRGEDDG